ncbi:carboxypeptidase regulatory-like domain-containing protein [Parabacteroides sp.]
MKYSKLILLINYLISTFFLEANAQSSVYGYIQEKSGKGIPYTTIRLLKTDSTFVKGAISDSLGYYILTDLKQDKYLLSVSSVGYISKIQTFTVDENSLNLPSIILHPDNILLNEIEVKGQSFIRKEDHVLIIPNKQQIKYALTGYDLLYNLMIPSIDVDRRKGSVSTLGGAVSLYIDGRKVDYREIQSLRPKDIERIEYFEVPTGKYAGDVASINYITKKQTSGGYIALDGKQTIGYLDGDYNVVAKLSKGNTHYSLFIGNSMNKYENGENNLQETFEFDNPIIRNSTTYLSKVKKNRQYTQFNIINQNKKRILLIKVNFIHANEPDNLRDNQLSYSSYYDSILSKIKTENRSIMPSLNLYGNFNIRDNQTLETNITSSYTNNDYSRNYTEGEFISQTNVDEDMYEMQARFNYNINLKHSNSITAQLAHYHRVTSSDYTGDYNYWQHLWSGETLLFLNYKQTFANRFSLSGRIGLSSLQYHLHEYDKINHVTPRANLNLMYKINRSQAFYTMVNLGNTYPEINTINSTDQTIDMLHIKRGNPNLDKTLLYSIYSAYSIQVDNINMIGMFEYASDINAVLPYYYIENNKLIQSFRSDYDYNRMRSGLNVSWKANKNLQIKTIGTWVHEILRGDVDDSQNNVYIKLDANYYLKDFAVNIYGQTQTAILNVSGIHEKQDGNYGLSVGWHHKNWMIEAGVNNLFWNKNTTQYYMGTDVYTYNQQVYNRLNQQAGYIKVAYTFEFGKKTSRDKKDIDMNINSAILKAE